MPISHIHAVLLVLVLCIFADLKFFGNTGTSAAIGNWDKWRRLEEAGRAAEKVNRVLDNVLSGATKLPKHSLCCEDFQKFGGYRDAVRDFNTLELEDVNRFILPRGVMGKAGEVGDRTVWVRSAGMDGRPVLEIIKRKKYMEAKDNLEWMATDPPIIRIFYTKIKPTEK